MRLASLLSVALVVVGCGGGGSGSGASPTPPSGSGGQSVQTGGIAVLLGDSPLDGVAEVNILVREVVLIGGSDGQIDLDVTIDEPINLLALQNLTELLVATDVPADTYSKIRLYIDELEIVEVDGDRELAQLPANGKIDLNPQGEFEISAGEDLVVQIDLDLERSIKLTQTGNSGYRFRPVVFIDVIDQSEGLRPSRFVGELEVDGGLVSLCLEPDDCTPLAFADGALLLDSDGAEIAVEDLVTGDLANVFGSVGIGLTGERSINTQALVLGGDDAVERLDGEVASSLAGGAFDLLVEEGADPIMVELAAGAVLLGADGQPLTEDFVVGDEAELWGVAAVVDAAEAGTFPSFLGLFSADDIEASTEGVLVAIDGDELIVRTSDGDECVLNVADTDIQQLIDDSEGAESMGITLVMLADLLGSEPVIEVFGEQDGECLIADLIVVESSGS